MSDFHSNWRQRLGRTASLAFIAITLVGSVHGASQQFGGALTSFGGSTNPISHARGATDTGSNSAIDLVPPFDARLGTLDSIDLSVSILLTVDLDGAVGEPNSAMTANARLHAVRPGAITTVFDVAPLVSFSVISTLGAPVIESRSGSSTITVRPGDALFDFLRGTDVPALSIATTYSVTGGSATFRPPLVSNATYSLIYSFTSPVPEPTTAGLFVSPA